jgi:Ca2+-binding RTX toxin-like protein
MTDYVGTAGPDSFVGGTGDDSIDLRAGGSDTAIGGGGNDVFLVGGALNRGDRLWGDGGNASLLMEGDYSGLVLGRNTIRGMTNMQLAQGHHYDLTLDDGNIAAGDAMTVTSWGDLVLDASAELDGAVRVVLLTGAAHITGSAGDDLLSASTPLAPTGSFDGGAGEDTLDLHNGGTIRLTGAKLTGVESINQFSTATARVVLADDGVVAEGGHMAYHGSSGNLVFNGARERDGVLFVYGGAGDDTIIGGRHGDYIDPGAGAARLTGGGGGDYFVVDDADATMIYRSRADSVSGQADEIEGLGAGDVIDLSAMDADRFADGNQAFTLVDSFSGAAGEAMLVYVEEEDGTELWLETNGKGLPDMVIIMWGGDHTGFDGLVL